MAAFGELVELCTCFHEKDLLFVDADGLPGHVIITCKSNSVFVFKLDDQKAIHSWSVRRGQDITSPARWTSDTGYITVINHQNIHTWGKEELSFEKAKKKHVKFCLHEIVTCEGWDPIAVCEDGTVDFVDNIKASHKQTDRPPRKILSCGIASTNKAVCVVCLSQNGESELTIRHHWCGSNSKTWTVQETRDSCPQGTRCVDSQCEAVASSVRLYCLVSNGSMITLDLCSDQADAVERVVQTIPGVQDNAAFTVLDAHHIAVAGATQDKQDKQVGIGIYDLQFGTLQTWRPYPAVVQSKVQLYNHHGNLLIACGNTMYLVPYTCHKSTVASILGQRRQVTNGHHSNSFPGHFQWPISSERSLKAQTVRQQRIVDLTTELCDQGKTKTYGQFKSKLAELMKAIEGNEYAWCGSKMFSDVLTRCVTEQNFWPCTEITQLLQQCSIPTSVLPPLVEALINHSETCLLHSAFHSLSEIPEVCLCKALQYYLMAEDEELAKASDAIDSTVLPADDTSTQPISVHKAFFINSLLTEPFNDVFLVDCIKSLSFKCVLMLLEYLYHILGERVEGEEEDFIHQNTPTVLQIADWICVTLDAHITQLIISPDARLLLVNLHTCVAAQVQFYDELAGLDALLEQLKAKCSVPTKQAVRQYCIEVLHVR